MQMSCGREFQRQGEERLKALDPMVVKWADGVVCWMAEEDLRVQEGVWKDTKVLGYERPLKVRSTILNSIWY